MSVTPVVTPPAPSEGGAQEPAKSSALLWIILACALGGCCVFGGILAAIAVPGVIGARKAAGESAGIGSLRTLATAQALYREGDMDRNGTLDHASSLGDLERAGLIDKEFGSGTKRGYRFEIVDAGERSWSATAVPLAPGTTGDRTFFVDESGVIRFRVAPGGEPATALDAPIGR